MLREKAKLQKKNYDYYYTVSKKIHEIQTNVETKKKIHQCLEKKQNYKRKITIIITLYRRRSTRSNNDSMNKN